MARRNRETGLDAFLHAPSEKIVRGLRGVMAADRQKIRRVVYFLLPVLIAQTGCFTLAKRILAPPKQDQHQQETPQGPAPRTLSEVPDCDLRTLTIPSPLSSTAVLDFQAGEGINTDARTVLADLCREAVKDSNCYLLVERELMRALLSEEDFAATVTCDDTRCLVDYGKKLRAQKVVHGRISHLGESFVVTMKMVDVGTAAVNAIRSATIHGTIEETAAAIRPTTCALMRDALRDEGRQGRGNGHE